jgi:hypothetical protein
LLLLDEVAARLKLQETGPLYPYTTILTEAPVKDHQILVIQDTTTQQLKFSFILGENAWQEAQEGISRDDKSSMGQIAFQDRNNPMVNGFIFSESFYKQVGHSHIHVATAKKDGKRIQAAEGFVQVSIPLGSNDIGSVLKAATPDLTQVMETLGIPNWDYPLSEVTQTEWMQQAYTLQSGSNVNKHEVVVEEVYRGYSTPVVVGRDQELAAQFGRYAIYHYFAEKMLIPLAHSGVLLSKLRRMQLGATAASGNSTQTDFETGGACGAFTTATVQRRVQSEIEKGYDRNVYSIVAIVDPTELNRTDYRALPYDWYGAADEQGLTPEHFINFVATDPNASRNEIVFRNGVLIKAFAVPQGRRNEIIEYLIDNGITQMNGKPIQDVIFEADTQLSWFDIAWREHSTSIID